MNLDGIYSAIGILADLEAVAGELAEHHADDRTAHVFGWLARESQKARTCLALHVEGGRDDEAA
jgi:hypothetical protein